MVTHDQRQALLSVTCPWCHAGTDEPCTVPTRNEVDAEGGRRRRRPRHVTTLDGGCHDARWRQALGVNASVISAAVEERQARVSAVMLMERPW